MIALEPAARGIILPLLAHPKAPQNAITGVHDGCLKVAVTAAPEKGRANKAIVNLLAAELNLKKSQLEIVSGQTSQRKKCLVSGVSLDELHHLIAACIAGD